jgi:hypothetical protein
VAHSHGKRLSLHYNTIDPDDRASTLSKETNMTLQQFKDMIALLSPQAEVLASLFKVDGTVQAFAIDDVTEEFGIIHIELSEEAGMTY